MAGNYIETANPFSLARPPQWFLDKLFAYDPKFIIFPSVKHGYYCTGRRGRYEHGLNRVIPGAPDSEIYVREKAWPWKPILPEGFHTTGWAGILLAIPEFDTQRYGNDPGKELDELEDARDAAIDATIADNADRIAQASWGQYQLETGARVGPGQRARHNTKSAPRRRRSRRPVTQGQPGALWLGRR